MTRRGAPSSKYTSALRRLLLLQPLSGRLTSDCFISPCAQGVNACWDDVPKHSPSCFQAHTWPFYSLIGNHSFLHIRTRPVHQPADLNSGSSCSRSSAQVSASHFTLKTKKGDVGLPTLNTTLTNDPFTCFSEHLSFIRIVNPNLVGHESSCLRTNETFLCSNILSAALLWQRRYIETISIMQNRSEIRRWTFGKITMSFVKWKMGNHHSPRRHITFLEPGIKKKHYSGRAA